MTDRIIRAASTSVSGATRWAMSPTSSVVSPDRENDTTGPSSGSSPPRITHAVPGGAIACTSISYGPSAVKASMMPRICR